MIRAVHVHHTPRGSANSRRGGVRWTRTLRCTRRSIRSTLRRVEASARVIDAAERFAPSRRADAARQFVLVSIWLAQAAGYLSRAARGLEQTTTCWMEVAGEAADGPQRIAEATGRWVDAAGRLVAVSNRLEVSFARLVHAVAARPIADGNGDDAPAAFINEVRAEAGAVDGARKISRGRAPPFVSIRTL